VANSETTRSSSRPEKFDPAKWQFSPSVTANQRVRYRCSTASGALANQECATDARKPGALLNSNSTASRAVSLGQVSRWESPSQYAVQQWSCLMTQDKPLKCAAANLSLSGRIPVMRDGTVEIRSR
jgi:hypothetical protein